MGRRVSLPSLTAPRVYIERSCPACGQPVRVINGAWLAYRRLQAGLNQRTLAARLGVSSPYLSDLERNRRNVPDTILTFYQRLPSARRKFRHR